MSSIQPDLTTAQVSKIFQCSIWQVSSLIRAGKLAAYDISIGTKKHARWRIPQASIDAFRNREQSSLSRLDRSSIEQPRLVVNGHVAKWKAKNSLR